MKTKEELNALKEEVETLNKKLRELTEEELAEVTGGKDYVIKHPKIISPLLRVAFPQKDDYEKYVMKGAKPLDTEPLGSTVLRGPTSSE